MVRACLVFFILLTVSLGMWNLIAQTQETHVENVENGVVRGYISDITRQQSPIANVHVTLTRLEPDFETTTNAKGEFELTNLAPGRYVVTLSKDDYDRGIVQLVTVVNRGEQYVTLKMGPEAIENVPIPEKIRTPVPKNGGTVRGQIVDTSTAQNPIPDVRVVIASQDGEYEATTDANGEFERTGVPAGRYLISIYREGYGDREGKPVTVVNGGEHYIPLKMTQKFSFFQKLGKVFGF